MVDKNSKDNSSVLKRFGKYLILDHIVDGGMAKIFRARHLDQQANKVVAIKMVQSKYSEEESFTRMFLDEVRVSFGLIHPNIAQTYDTGMMDGRLFTVMEYVDGQNLKQFLDRLKERRFVFPVEISIYIISQACQGLSYAHNYTDQLTGKKCNIIHRDITPHNIMISYDGAVKIIDFGIAKAETNSDATQAGTIKGKLSYIAPEYIDGLDLDPRYDLFAVGITLWELLCSRKLFKAKNDLAVLKEIQKCKVPPPSSINPNVSKELDAIVLKALNKDRNLRYENMEQFNRALVKFLYSNYPDFNPNDLSYFGQELFKEDIKKDRLKLYEFGKIDITNYLKELANQNQPQKDLKATPERENEMVLSSDIPSTAIVNSAEGERTRETVFDMDFKDGNLVDATRISQMKVATASKTDQPLELESTQTAENLSMDATKVLAPTPPRKKQNKYSKMIKEKKEEEGKEGVKNKITPKKIIAALAVAGIAVFFIFKKHPDIIKNISTKSEKTLITDVPDEKIDKREIYPDAKGLLVLSYLSIYQQVFINDKEISYSGAGYKLPLYMDFELKVSERGKIPFVTSFQLTDNDPEFYQTIPDLLRANYGELISRANYREGTEIKINVTGGRIIKKKLPFSKALRLPAGKYEATIYNKGLDIKKRVEFKIEQDRRIKLPY